MGITFRVGVAILFRVIFALGFFFSNHGGDFTGLLVTSL